MVVPHEKFITPAYVLMMTTEEVAFFFTKNIIIKKEDPPRSDQSVPRACCLAPILLSSLYNRFRIKVEAS